jgi:hypothetical protein
MMQLLHKKVQTYFFVGPGKNHWRSQMIFTRLEPVEKPWFLHKKVQTYFFVGPGKNHWRSQMIFTRLEPVEKPWSYVQQ